MSTEAYGYTFERTIYRIIAAVPNAWASYSSRRRCVARSHIPSWRGFSDSDIAAIRRPRQNCNATSARRASPAAPSSSSPCGNSSAEAYFGSFLGCCTPKWSEFRAALKKFAGRGIKARRCTVEFLSFSPNHRRISAAGTRDATSSTETQRTTRPGSRMNIAGFAMPPFSRAL